MTSELILTNNEINIDAACEAIGHEWRTTINAMFNIVELIRKVDGKKGFRELQEELDRRGIMKRSVFVMFKSIAENQLIQMNIKDKLPPSYNTLYYVAKIEDVEVFESAIKDGIISPGSKLEDIKSFVNGLQKGESEVYDSYKPKPSQINLASLRIDPTDFKKNKKQILHHLNELQELGLVVKLGKEFQ
jgi:DNA-binding HxlR family transcriptional regulator